MSSLATSRNLAVTVTYRLPSGKEIRRFALEVRRVVLDIPVCDLKRKYKVS